MLPSASLGESDAKTKKRRSLFEPVQARRLISRQRLANPIAMISSFAWRCAIRSTSATRRRVDAAIAAVLVTAFAPRISSPTARRRTSTTQMGEAILKELQKLHA